MRAFVGFNMVIVQLNGGLGNQLFQYATGYAVAKCKGVSLKLDVSAFASDPQRSFRLHYFNISGSIAAKSDSSY